MTSSPPATAALADPPHAPRRERRKDRRPAELLDAALALFVEHGYAATRLEDIAARAGVSKGTLYLYFANKEELFKALVSENLLPLIERFRAETAASDAPAALLLRHALRTWWREFGGTRLAGLAKLVVAEAGNFPDVARFFEEEAVRPTHALLADLVRRGIERGEFRPIDVETAVYLWISPLALKAIWMNSVDRCLPDRARVDPERLIDVHLDLILAALRPTPP